jgi:hypothetical protein
MTAVILYTPEEDAYLRAHPDRSERAEVARKLGRSPAAITQRLSKLGVISIPDRLPPRHPSYERSRERRPPSDPLDQIARPAWFDEDRRAFARRLMAGR